MIDFNAKYASIHSEIQKDANLVSTAYCLAKELGLRNKHETRYFHVGSLDNLHLGLALYEKHVQLYFGDIVAKMRLLYEVSEGNTDILRVYARLENELGILSEDVSYGVGYFKDDTPQRHLDLELLTKVFNNPIYKLEKTTFWSETGNNLRKPIADLDHAVVRPEFKDRVREWSHNYNNNPIFQIKKL